MGDAEETNGNVIGTSDVCACAGRESVELSILFLEPTLPYRTFLDQSNVGPGNDIGGLWLRIMATAQAVLLTNFTSMTPSMPHS